MHCGATGGQTGGLQPAHDIAAPGRRHQHVRDPIGRKVLRE
jgi:hypothetical protein